MNDKLYLKRFAICLAVILRICCLAPYKIDLKNLRIKRSNTIIFINLFVLGIFLTFTDKLLEIIYEDHDLYFHIDIHMDLVLISNNVLHFKNYFLISCAIIWAIVKNPQREKSTAELFTVLKMLRTEILFAILAKRIQIFVQHHLKLILLFITISYLYYFIPIENPSIFIALTYLPISEYPKFVINALVSQQHLILIGFKSSLKALNIFFKTQINYASNQCELSDLVDKTAEIHFRLFEIAKFYNQHFSF